MCACSGNFFEFEVDTVLKFSGCSPHRCLTPGAHCKEPTECILNDTLAKYQNSSNSLLQTCNAFSTRLPLQVFLSSRGMKLHKLGGKMSAHNVSLGRHSESAPLKVH